MSVFKVMKRGCLGTVVMVMGVCALWWIGTRNLSDTSGSVIVERAEACNRPNNDFTYCTNPSIPKAARRNYPVSGDYHPFTCINTATSIYDPHNTCSYCPDFVRNPQQWHFREVSASERQPGDLVIFENSVRPYHAAIYIGESLLGPLINESDGLCYSFDYWHHIPFKLRTWILRDRVRYYRYTATPA